MLDPKCPRTDRCRLAFLSVVVFSISSLIGCGGGTTSQTDPSPSPTINSVSVSPDSVSVSASGTQQFAAVVKGTGTFNSNVSWKVNGVEGGSLGTGTIDNSGLFKAPGFAPSPNTVSVSATSVADPTKSGMAQASITGVAAGPASVSLTPATAALGPNAQASFTATVIGNGIFDESVTWSVNGVTGGNASVGTINTSGTYTSPNSIPTLVTVTIMATTVAAPKVSGTAAVSIAGVPTITSISPALGAPGDQIQISGIDLGSLRPTVIFSGSTGLGIPKLTEQWSPTTLTVRVPQGAVTGSVIVQVTSSDGSSTNSNGLPFTRVPDLRIRAPKADLGAAESDALKSVVFGSHTPNTITWSADVGNISGNGLYIAPASITSDSFAHISACLQNTDICDTLLLHLHPFRVDPTAPVVALGNNLLMQGLAAGTPISATWSKLSGGGTLLADGSYAASTLASDGGTAMVSATYQGLSEPSSIAVTGGFPGLVNRVYDYLDFTTLKIQRVTQPVSVAVSGNRAYVLSEQTDTSALDQKFTYIDVYDIKDPVHPVWANAVEAVADGQLYSFAGVLYVVNANGSGNFSNAMAAYDISGISPVLIAFKLLPDMFAWSFYGGVFTVSERSGYPADAMAQIDQFYLQGGNLVERQISLPPAITGGEFALAGVSATANRLYVTESNTGSTGSPSLLAAYNITSNPPTLAGVVSLPESTLTAESFITSSYLNTAQQIFDITKDPPALVGNLPEAITTLDGNSTRLLGRKGQNGLRVIDVSDPTNPHTASSFFDFVNVQQTGVLVGNYVYAAEQLGGLAIYDISAPGGQQFTSSLIDKNFGSFAALAQVSNTTSLFAGGSGSNVSVFDLQQHLPLSVASIPTGSFETNALALMGNNLFVGTEQALLTIDISLPNQPKQIGSLTTPINALSVSGNFLFAGTTTGRLVVYNVASPASPTVVASVTLPDRPIELTNVGNLLLIADRTGGLLIFDVSNPSNPVSISQLAVSPAVLGVKADGNLALLAVLEKGLVIVDLTVPSRPQIISETALDSFDPFSPGLPLPQNRAAVIATSNKIAFIGAFNFDPSDTPSDGNGMVYGFDYRQPQQPRLVSLAAHAIAIAGGITSLYAADNSLFISGNNIGLIQVDASQPRNSINLFYPPAALRPLPVPPFPIP